MTSTVVYALDIGVYFTGRDGQVLARTTAAWCRVAAGLRSAAGPSHEDTRDRGRLLGSDAEVFECGKSIEELARAIAADLDRGNEVALGFEAPMWFPLILEHSGPMRLFDLRSEGERGFAWYLQSGAAATLKAISLGSLLRERLRSHLGGALPPLSTCSSARGGSLTLFEGFVAGEYKAFGRDVTDEVDAFVAALAWGSAHHAFELPSGFSVVQMHGAGEHQGPCFSVWSTIFPGERIAGPPDCEVIALRGPES